MRLIDADALIEAIEADMKHIEDPLSRMFMEANISDIRHMPTIEPERKTGRWRPVQIGKWHGFECTACKINREVPCGNKGIPQWKYCPNCGAIMDGEHDG